MGYICICVKLLVVVVVRIGRSHGGLRAQFRMTCCTPCPGRTWTCCIQQLSHKYSMDLMRTFRAHIARNGVEEGSRDTGADLGSGVAVKRKYAESNSCLPGHCCVSRDPVVSLLLQEGTNRVNMQLFSHTIAHFCTFLPEVGSRSDSIQC